MVVGTDVLILTILAGYILYWVVKAMVDKLYFEALFGMGVGVLSAQIFIVANYYGQFLRLPMDEDTNVALQAFGILLLAISLALLTGAFLSKRKVSSLVSFWGNTQLFMTQGIYGIVRHPVSLGGILAALGIALLMASPAVIALGMIACIAFLAASREEDRHSRESLGSEYDSYMKRVPAFNLVRGLVRAKRAIK